MHVTSSTPLKGKSHQFVLSDTTVDDSQQSFTTILGELGYKVKSSDWKETVYTKGNRILRLLFGAFVKYNKLGVSFSASGETVTTVVNNNSSGFSGGVIGVVQANKEFKKIITALDDKLGTSIY